MKKFFTLGVLWLCWTGAFAQEKRITGTVTAAEDNATLPGVSVVLKGSTRGTTTDADGNYTVTLPADGNILTFSYVGFAPQDVTIGNQTTINVALRSDTRLLNEVIVTGFGIRRNEREIGTSVTRVTSDLINQAAPVNVANGLAGKVAGLQINLTNNGVGASPRITIRGSRSFLGNNQALLVVDGVITDVSFLSSINPNDIESTTILKGPSAAALYGSDASNGVMVLTTKRGTTNTKPQISFTSNTQFESVSYLPGLQRTFSSNGGEGGKFLTADGRRLYVPFENQSFGPAYDGSIQPLGAPVQVRNARGGFDTLQLTVPFSSTGVDPRRAFFNTGVTQQYDLSYRVGDAQNYFGLGVQRVDQSGIVPNDKYERTTLSVNGGRATDKFHTNNSVLFSYQNSNTEAGDFSQGRPVYWNLLNQPAHAPLRDPRLMDINGPYGDVNGYFNAYYPNPWWQVSGDNSRLKQNIFTLQGSADFGYQFAPWFDITYRVGGQLYNEQTKTNLAAVNFSEYALSDPAGAGNIASSVKQVNGRAGDYSSTRGRFTGDLLVTLSPTFGQFTTKLILGQQTRVEFRRDLAAAASALVVPGVYNIANRLGQPDVFEFTRQSRLVGFFGDLTLGYKFVYLNLTGRQDNTSLLAAGNRSYFYPSASVSAIVSDAIPALKTSEVLTYLKVRGSVARAGNVNVLAYQLQNVFNPGPGFPFGSQPGFGLSSALVNPDLKPEFTTNREVGLEVGLFSRFNLEAVYFSALTTNQTVPIAISRSTGFASALVNSGEMKSQGLELELKSLRPLVQAGGFSWNLAINYTYLKNEVRGDIYPGLPRIQIPNGSGTTSNGIVNGVINGVQPASDVFAANGYGYPSLFVTDIARVQSSDAKGAYYDATGQLAGRPVVDSQTGYPILDPVRKFAGTTQPINRFGFQNTFGFKGFTLLALVEYRGGNVIYNQLGSALEFTGAGIRTTYNGRENFVYPNSVLATTNADGTQSFKPNTNVTTRDGNLEFWTNSGFHNAQTPYVTSAAFWKLRELALSYNVPVSALAFTKVVRTLSIGVTGRNLLMWRPATNVFTDPEFSLDNSNAQGVSNEYQTPPTRLYGFRVQVGF